MEIQKPMRRTALSSDPGRGLLASLGFAFLLFGFSPVSGQETPAETLSAAASPAADEGATQDEGAAGFFIDTVDVSVVNVEVYVTDEKGERVTDLERDDFRVFEDGKEQTISNFFVVTERRKRQAERAALRRLPTRDAPESIETISDDQRLHLVVYVDNSNIHPFHRNNVFNYVRTFLGTNLASDDLIAIYTYEKELHLREPFTTSRAAINDSLREIEGLSAFGTSQESTRRDLLRDIDRATSRSQIEGRLRMHAESLANDLSFTIDSMKSIVDSLAGLPGRKAILHVSDGLPMRPAEDLYQALGDRFEDPTAAIEAVNWDASRQFGELTARANANRVTFYTIEAAGLRSYSSGTADTSSARSNVALDSIKRRNYQSPLQSMASETGGIAIIGTSNFRDALQKVGQDLETYYSLGYIAPHGGDGRYHDLEVKVARKGLKVRSREGYRAKTPSVWMSERTTAMLDYDLGSNPLGIRVDFGRMSPGEGGRYVVPIVVSVPIRNLVLIPQETLHRGRLTLFLSARDDRGRIAEVGDEAWPIEIPSDRMEEALEMSFSHEVSLLMRPGRQRISIGARDELGSVSAFIRTEFTVGRSGSAR